MTTRRTTILPTTGATGATVLRTGRRTGLRTGALAAVLAGLLGGCGSTGTTTGSTSSTTSTTTTAATATPTPTTVTVTTTVTASPTTQTPKPDTSSTTPPPAKDSPAIPRSAQDYGAAFVKAWVAGDRTRATQLGTESAVKAAFASTVDTMPTFVRCEGAAGSSYCTWQGDEYTMQVRLRNDLASTGQPHAVIEVVFQH